MLTDIAIRRAIRDAKAAGKPVKRYDERGLYLLLKPGGTALWRFKYVFDGLEKCISLGAYADVPLARARAKRDEARAQVADAIDPSQVRKAKRIAQADSVEAIAREWLAKQTGVTPGTLRRDRRRLEAFVFPYIGRRPINAVEPRELLDALRRVEARGLHETAHRTLSVAGRVWRYAISTGRAARDITLDLKDALTPTVVKNLAAIKDPRAIGQLLRAIDDYLGTPVVRIALALTPLLCVRPGELRRMEWSELDLDAEEPLWRIPAEKMKARSAHLVPLATQAVALLREIELHTRGGRYVFPSARGGGRPMSENAINLALRALGFDGDTQVAHGFRSVASTLLNELGWNGDLIELALAHRPSTVRSIYNKAERLAERRVMMQAWADYLRGLRASSANVVAIRSRIA
ncbi:MAG: tyrosine-type recombinase/integrase [Pseudomonadota bacterium]|nr:tyrosine-type recombinase/integrase [Pseudomonadota bacterium]